MAGHKGYAIATMMDVLSGVLGGSRFGSGVVGPYSPDGGSGAGHFAFALNIAAFRPRDAFEADMEILIENLKTTPQSIGKEKIFYPGELEAREDLRNRRLGLMLPEDTLADLDAKAEEFGIAPLCSGPQ